jgi:hypothetical protein
LGAYSVEKLATAEPPAAANAGCSSAAKKSRKSRSTGASKA